VHGRRTAKTAFPSSKIKVVDTTANGGNFKTQREKFGPLSIDVKNGGDRRVCHRPIGLQMTFAELTTTD